MMESMEEWEMGERPLALLAAGDAAAAAPPDAAAADAAVADAPAEEPPKVQRRCKVFGIALLAALGAALASFVDAWTAASMGHGVSLGPTGNVTQCFAEHPSLSTSYGHQQALYASLLALGASAGSALFAYASERWSHRSALLCVPGPAFLGWAILLVQLLLAGDHVRAEHGPLPRVVFSVARVLAGMSLGGTCAVHPVFISEFASPVLRGGAGCMLGVASGLGWVLAPLMRTFASPMIVAVTPVIAVILMVVAICALPSAKAKVKGKAKANASANADANAEAEQPLQVTVDDSPAAAGSPPSPRDAAAAHALDGERESQRRGTARALVVAAAIMMATPLLAADALHLLVALTVDLEVAQLEGSWALPWIMAALAYPLGALFTSHLIDIWGRRPTLVAALSLAAAGHAGLALFYAHAVPLGTACQALWRLTRWEPLAVAPALLGMGSAAGAWLFAAELLPADRRVRATGALGVLRWAVSLLVLHGFSLLCTGAGPWQAFALLAVAAFLAVLGAARLLPETRGRSLQEIQDELMAPDDQPPQ